MDYSVTTLAPADFYDFLMGSQTTSLVLVGMEVISISPVYAWNP